MTQKELTLVIIIGLAVLGGITLYVMGPSLVAMSDFLIGLPLLYLYGFLLVSGIFLGPYITTGIIILVYWPFLALLLGLLNRFTLKAKTRWIVIASLILALLLGFLSYQLFVENAL